MISVTPLLVALGCITMPGEEAMKIKPISSVSLLSLFHCQSHDFYFELLPWFPAIMNYDQAKTNNTCSQQVAYGHGIYHNSGKQTKTAMSNFCVLSR